LDRVIPRPAPWQQALLADKQCMAAFIAGHGVAVPRELHLTESSESLGTPFVLKGVRGRGGAATHIVRSRGDAERAAARLRDRGIACFAQEYVAGSTFLVGGLFRKGEPVRLYAGEKLVQYPSRTGPAAVIRSIDSEQLVMNALTVMKALAWTGLASVDFVRDATGRFLFLEVNPRPWGSIVAAADAGVELWAPLATLMEGGAPAQSLAYRAGVTSVILPLALLSGASWRSWSALSGMVRAAAGPQRAIWWPPRRGAHVARRLLLMSRRWTDGP
jgi:predicted ATP-grasp superfamily ATP-dependent carboligase